MRRTGSGRAKIHTRTSGKQDGDRKSAAGANESQRKRQKVGQRTSCPSTVSSSFSCSADPATGSGCEPPTSAPNGRDATPSIVQTARAQQRPSHNKVSSFVWSPKQGGVSIGAVPFSAGSLCVSLWPNVAGRHKRRWIPIRRWPP